MKKKPCLKVTPAGRTPKDEVAGSSKGIRVTETGTLCIQLQDGQPVEVRKGGSSIPHRQQAEPAIGNLLGQIQWEDLKIGHVIGEGNQAKVRKVKHKHTGQLYAMKSMDLLGAHKIINKRTLQTELSRLQAAKHPNVVSSNEAFFIDGKLKVLMEYMNLGTLSSVLKQIGPIPSPVLSIISKQIVQGLGHLHASGIVHRDIKPSNLLVNSSGEVKIADFGVSTILTQQGQRAKTQIGSTAYMSPERIRGDEHNSASDVWSVGITIAECSIGVFPLYTEDVDLSENATENPFTQRTNMFDLSALIAERRAVVEFELLVPHVVKYYPRWPRPILTEDLKDFCKSSMSQEPNDRPDWKQMLEHPFISANNEADEVDLRRWLKDRGVCKSGGTKASTISSHEESVEADGGNEESGAPSVANPLPKPSTDQEEASFEAAVQDRAFEDEVSDGD
uniref:mitogen-activated protein kinase kinase n=1 Tax=Eutreptiella gymnastica TaxID=73025 RepID=A0A7S1J174_9EUGL|mmetsp:Transcript_59396/g.105965  ORF Transcript_59396/g.105965 Transcript_59396/m.105965 type:complete len:448 (+) Transcript_59396:151-1494(+)